MANLWDVTDLDIDRFARGVLDQWLGEASPGLPCPSHSCLFDAVDAQPDCVMNISRVPHA